MRIYRTKEAIRNRLLKSLQTGQGIHTEAISMESGSHHWWLTGTEEAYKAHCFGNGQGWRDQSDECNLDLEEMVDHLWKLRAHIIEEEWAI